MDTLTDKRTDSLISIYRSIGLREYQEDMYSILYDTEYLHISIFDGHGGKQVSELLAERFLPLMHRKIEKNRKLKLPNDLMKILPKVVKKIDTFIGQHSKLDNIGSTLLYVGIYRTENKLLIANIGDSRCIGVSNQNTELVSTIDHKPSHPSEEKRIIDMGKHVPIWDKSDEIYRICGYALSRAVGDHAAKDVLISMFDFTTISRTNCKFLIIASDGLWDAMTNDEVISFVASRYDAISSIGSCELIDICKELVKYAQSRITSSGDNVTVILIPLSKMEHMLSSG